MNRKVGLALCVGMLITVLGLGCGGETSKGTNKDKDRQTPPAKSGT